MTTLDTNFSAIMAEEEDALKFGEAIDVRYGYIWTSLTVIFFQFVNRFLSYLGTPKSVTITDSWKWRNLLISWIHALICGVGVLSCIYLYLDMFQDLISYANYYMYGLVSFSTGYFIYDFVDMIINNKIFKLWEVSLHHIAVISLFSWNVFAGTCIAYNVVALLAEVNSFFLHSRKLLQMLRVDFRHWFYRLTAVVNLVTFVIFRGLSLGSISYGMYMWRARVHIAYYLSLGGSMFIMNVINPVLFWRLLKNDFLRRPRSEDPKSETVANGHLVNNNVKDKET